MEAARASETLVNFYQTTRRYNPEDSHLQIHMEIRNLFLFSELDVGKIYSKQSKQGTCKYHTQIRTHDLRSVQILLS
jgi:hypothetical protein